MQPLWKTVWRVLKKLKIELPYDPAIPLLGIQGIYPEKTIIQKDIFKKKKNTITNAGEDVEKREPSYTVGRNVNWCSHYGKQYGGSSEN